MVVLPEIKLNDGNSIPAVCSPLNLLSLDLWPQIWQLRYPIHSPFVVKSDKDLQGVWAETENAKESSKVRSIGVSNFRQRELEAVLKTARIIPAINQIEYHPYLEHGDTVLLKEKRGIRNVAYDPPRRQRRLKVVHLMASWLVHDKLYFQQVSICLLWEWRPRVQLFNIGFDLGASDWAIQCNPMLMVLRRVPNT
ncbi:aldo/keto reductase [Histoplasma capsulatum G186AR]|uniref:Aldo/keto reductase n=1 Tax=Ajellomyces capsulatus (strain G186AR / H82 / ATCC MYA-2454 / RMSCC 2432) TaxID=447093 RepID=C0NYG1_AJECG|nr:aldo/keto reductase [Histoplasma capsulatum G186AR]EEH03829.1 aldo/keto reductase [Histoplasma capsulatum G186AR]